MKPLTGGRFLVRFGACLLALCGLLVLSPGVGSELTSVTWSDAWRARLGLPIDRGTVAGRDIADTDGDGHISNEELAAFGEIAVHIGFEQRFARSALALQVGMTLALCGAVLQVLFRNPLATPYTLGIVSGGALGALIAIRAGWTASVLGVPTLSVAACIGGLAVVGAVFLLARGSRRLMSNELLLAGVTIGLFCSAMMMLVTAVSSQRETFAIVRWMMGSLDTITTAQSVTLLPVLVPTWVVLMLMARALNQYRLGDELAAARGVSIARLQGVSVLVCTIATAVVVARCGPIGFIGLVVPHMVVLMFGGDCRLLLPAAAVVGGAFLILCDWSAQLVMRVAGWLTGEQLGTATLPVGVLTAIIGVPIFVVLLRARRR